MKKIHYKLMLLFLSTIVAVPIGFAQLNLQQHNSNSLTASELQSMPKAYFNSNPTIISERVNGAGEISIANFNPRASFIPNGSNTNVPYDIITAIYDSGPFINDLGPPELSIVENVTLGMSTYGFGVQKSAQNSIADKFTLSKHYDITSIDTYVYQTGAAAASITGVYIQIYDGDPSSGGTVIWGDITTSNLLLENEVTDVHRVLENEQNDTSRKIQKVTAETPDLFLRSGTYWIEVTYEGTVDSGPWAVPISILGQATTGNAIQSTDNTWSPLIDSGTNSAQGIPFRLYGDEVRIIGDMELDGCNLGTVGNFEDGQSFSKSLNHIVAQDIIVPADQYMMLNKINLNAIIGKTGSGVNAANVDIYVYEDDGGIPGDLVTMVENIVPILQTDVTEESDYQFWDIELDFDVIELAGQEGEETVYWIGASLETTDSSDALWEWYSDTSAAVVGHGLAYNDGAGFTVQPNLEGVYVFHATCLDIGTGYITTILDGSEGSGNNNNAIYFDVTVGSDDIELTAFDVHTNRIDSEFSLKVYTTRQGSYEGKESTQSEWLLKTVASGISSGENQLSYAPIQVPLELSANTTYGIALVMDRSHHHIYSIGDGTNEHFANDDLELNLGAATSTPFGDDVLSPRIFNGSLYYNVDRSLKVNDYLQTNFSFYPNPTSGIVNITANKNMNYGSVFNLLGQQVLSVLDINRGRVDLNKLPAGMYLFQIMFEDGSCEVFKIIKE